MGTTAANKSCALAVVDSWDIGKTIIPVYDENQSPIDLQTENGELEPGSREEAKFSGYTCETMVLGDHA